MTKFKKKIQFYFKKFFQLILLFVYGKIKYSNNHIASNNIIKRKIENIVSDIEGAKSYAGILVLGIVVLVVSRFIKKTDCSRILTSLKPL